MFLVKASFNFAFLTWRSYGITDNLKVENVHHRALAVVCKCNKNHYELLNMSN